MSGTLHHLDKAGTIGGIFAAFVAATPCCLPLLATAGASQGPVASFRFRYRRAPYRNVGRHISAMW